MSKVSLPNIYDFKCSPSVKQAEELADLFIQKGFAVTTDGNNLEIEGNFNEPMVRILTRLTCLDYVVFCGKKYECNGWRNRIYQAINKYNNNQKAM